MTSVPSIKGSVFRYHAEELLKLVSEGKISRDELSRRLEPGDLAMIDEPVPATRWYDIRAYERIVLLRWQIEGGGSTDVLLRYGEESAERLIAAGIYQQMDYLNRTQVSHQSDAGARFQAFGRDLHLLTSLTASLLSFVRTEVKVDPEWEDRYLIEYSDARAFPEVLCWTNMGFLNRMAAEHGSPDLWRWERPAPDRVIFRMTRSL